MVKLRVSLVCLLLVLPLANVMAVTNNILLHASTSYNIGDVLSLMINGASKSTPIYWTIGKNSAQAIVNHQALGDITDTEGNWVGNLGSFAEDC